MKKLSEYIGRPLFFTQKSFLKREFEFIAEEEMVAKMYYPKFLSTAAIVEGLDQKYEIKPTNFWATSVGIFKQGYQMPFSEYVNTSFWGMKGEITMPRGEKLKLKFGSFRRSCEVYSQYDDFLISFKNKFSLKEKNIVTIEKRSDLIDENPWIVFLTFYKILQQNRNSGAA